MHGSCVQTADAVFVASFEKVVQSLMSNLLYRERGLYGDSELRFVGLLAWQCLMLIWC
jgi:hypothetical protein